MDFIKRAFDISVSVISLIVLFIPFLIIALLSLIFQGAPVLFKQERYGRGGKTFMMYKFRTMKLDAPCMASNRTGGKYITKWGQILRKTSIDELPQLFNVLKGDMSIVGPRPLIVKETQIHKMRLENGIYSVRPGLTGWAQINGRDNLSNEEKTRLDREYIKNRSVLFDLKIIFKSFIPVIKHVDVLK